MNEFDDAKTILIKIGLKLGILVLELLREIYYCHKEEDKVDEKIKKRVSRLITNMRDELTKISRPFEERRNEEGSE